MCPMLRAGENHGLSWAEGTLFVTAIPEGGDGCGSGFNRGDSVYLLVVPWSGECSAMCPSRECCMATCCLKHKGPERYSFGDVRVDECHGGG